MKAYAFPRERRIRHRGVFLKARSQSARTATRSFVFLTMPNGLEHSRLGLIVTRKVGNAVVRNRIRRMIREGFRLSRPLDGVGCDIIVIPRPALPKRAPLDMVVASFQELDRRVDRSAFENEAH